MKQILLKLHEISRIGSKNNQKIATYMLAHKEEILTMSVQELSRKINVSVAAIPRFAQTLGLEGFPELKIALSADMVNFPDDKVLKEVHEQEKVADIKEKVSLRMEHMLQEVNQKLQDENVEQAVLKIEEATVIYCFGVGASGLVAQDIFQKFTRLGKHCFYITDVHVLLSMMKVQQQKALLILVSQTGERLDTVKIATIAQKMNIPMIGITAKDESALAQLVDIVLNSTSGEAFPVRTAATMSLLAQLYVVDILFYCYFSQNMKKSEQNILQTRKIVDEFEKV